MPFLTFAAGEEAEARAVAQAEIEENGQEVTNPVLRLLLFGVIGFVVLALCGLASTGMQP